MPTSSRRSKDFQNTLRDRLPHGLFQGFKPLASSDTQSTESGQADSERVGFQLAPLGQVDSELEELVERFEVAMAEDDTTDVGLFLPPQSHPRFAEIACELLRVDMEIQWSAGRSVSAEDYRRRFPQALEDENWYHVLVDEQQRISSDEPREALDQSSTRSLLPLTAEGDVPQTGQHVCGFDLLGELGRGAFSRVYLALENKLAQRLVVLKISSELPGEAETLSRLQHKNIVPIYSLHRHGQYYLICMPYLGGLTLADVMAPQGDGRTASITGQSLVNTLAAKASRTWRDPSLRWARMSSLGQAAPTAEAATENGLPAEKENVESQASTLGIDPLTAEWQSVPGLSSQLVDEVSQMTTTELALWLVSQLAEGLFHAHERGVLHRDIKPANILLSDDGMPMLLDFNLAVETRGAQSNPGVMGGTLRYMAPEQLRAVHSRQQTLSAQADVFSLGVVLYELLFQRPPFPDRTGNWDDVLTQMQQDRAQPPELAVRWSSGITPAVIAILRRALAHSVDARYASAEAMRDDLLAQIEHKPLVHARDNSLRERVGKWNARNPRWSAATIAGLAAVILLTITATGFLWRQARMNQIAATNWLYEVERAQTTARTLLASSDVPDTALQKLIDQTERVCNESDWKKHQSHLGQQQVNDARETLARIHFYRARGAWSIFSRHQDSIDSRNAWLTKTLAELRSSQVLSPTSLTGLWLDTLQPISERMQGADASGPTARNASLEASARLRDSSATVDAELEAAERAVAAEAGNPWHWIGVGQLQMAQHRLPEARNSFSLGNQLAPSDPLPAYMLGITELRLKNFPAALRWFDVVLDRDDKFIEARFNRAIVKTELGRFESALTDLDGLKDQMQRQPRAWFVRELVLRKLNRTAEAAECRSRGLAITPTDALGWNARGEAWLREKPPQAEKALADFDQSILLDPHFRNAYENAAHVLAEKMNQPKPAIARLDAALAIDPSYALALSSRAVLHARRGHAAAAREDCERALSIERTPIICYQAASAMALLLQSETNGDVADRSARQSDQQSVLALLKETLRKEPSLGRLMRGDSDLSILTDNADFREVLRAAQTLQ